MKILKVYLTDEQIGILKDRAGTVETLSGYARRMLLENLEGPTVPYHDVPTQPWPYTGDTPLPTRTADVGEIVPKREAKSSRLVERLDAPAHKPAVKVKAEPDDGHIHCWEPPGVHRCISCCFCGKMYPIGKK